MKIEIWWAFVIMSSVLINIFFIILFLYTKLEKAEGLLSDVKLICWYKNFFGSSLIGRQARLNALSMVVFMSGLLQKRGDLSREAYLRLPFSLVAQIRALYVMAFLNCLGMTGFYFLDD